jgi:S-adenosylmethionine decarboxylase
MHEILGKQVILDCWGCNARIASAEAVRAALGEAIAQANVTLLELSVREFHPQGVSAVALLAESHLFVHTWPEKSYLALDFFTCGSSAAPEKAIEAICAAFGPTHTKIQQIERGIGALKIR